MDLALTSCFFCLLLCAPRQDMTRIQEQVRSAWLWSSRSAFGRSLDQCSAKSGLNSCKCEEHGIWSTWSRYAGVSRALAGGSCLCLGRVFEVEQNVQRNVFVSTRRRTTPQLRHLPLKSPCYRATESASRTGSKGCILKEGPLSRVPYCMDDIL